MKRLRNCAAIVFASLFMFGVPLVGGGCTCGSAPPPMPTVSPHEQAKGSFDSYKEEYLSRKANRQKGGARRAK